MDETYVFLKACYLKYARRTNEATNYFEHDKWYCMASAVRTMLNDHYGASLTGQVLCDADLALPDDGRPATGGIYINHKFANKE
jgi:D-serine dehydratase